MKILVVGSGAREHALIKALDRSVQHPVLYCYGTSVNPGIKQFTTEYCTGDINECEAIVYQAVLWEIELVIIGPEAPLEQGLADLLETRGISVIGPKKQLAQIETSKEFARDLMKKYAIKGLPRYQKFTVNDDRVLEFLQALGEGNYVIKANGLMGGKGVKVAGEHLHSFTEALEFCADILTKKQTFIIEEKLIGQEFSFMCFVDGERLIPMPLVQDHKRAYNGDKGPNTGGMGSYSDANHSLPFLKASEVAEAFAINNAVFKALTLDCGERYTGILYGSFIATHNGVYVIEFNARFGDPEALNVLSILESDFVAICKAMVEGTLHQTEVKFLPQATVCKYAVPEGYPDRPCKDFIVDIEAVSCPEHLYLASVNQVDERLFAAGSRTVAYVGIAGTISHAEELAEKEISAVKGRLFHREDIGTSSLIKSRIDCMERIRSR